MAQAFDPDKLYGGEEFNDPSLISSILSGIATGLIRIPEGAVSLGATLLDLTGDTDKATEVEQWFDENIYKKLGNIEEKAESTTAGKIAAALINIGVPATMAYRYGTKAATKAIMAAKKGNYFTLSNPTLAKGAQEALQLNAKGKTARFMAGAVSGGIAEGIFVADVGEFGTIGDLLGGPTALDTESDEGGRDQAVREIVNRIKFGTEGALLTGIIGGTGSIIKQLATRGKELKYSNSLWDRALNRVASGFRPRGDLPEDAFLTRREQIGKRGADMNRAYELSRAVDRDIDRIFPNIKSTFNKTTLAEKNQLYKDLDGLLFSGKSGIDDAGRVTMGEMDATMMKNIGDKLINNGAKSEHVMNIFNNMGMMRNKWGDMATLIRSNLPIEAQPIFKNIMGDQFRGWLSRTYNVFQNKSLIPFLNYRPTAEAVEKVASIFMRQNRRAISRAETKRAAGEMVDVPAPLTYENAKTQVDYILKNIKPQDSLVRLMREADKFKAPSAPTFKVPASFVKDSVAADLVQNGTFVKRLEQVATKGRYALPGAEGIPGPTTIGRGSKAFRELFGEAKDVRQKMIQGTQRLSMVARKGEFLQKLVDKSATNIAAGGRGFFYGTEAAARNALGEADVALYKGSVVTDPKTGVRVARPWGETAMENPIRSAFPDGAWGERSLMEALEGAEKNIINNKTASFVYDSLFLFPKATSQFAKTVLSPVTHARNFFSAATFQTANGIWFENPKVLAQAWKRALGSLQPQSFAQNTPEANAFYREMLELGVTNTNVRYGDISRLMGDINFGQRITTDRAARMMLQPNWAKKFAKWSQDMYVAEDDFWKISNYILENYRYGNAYKRAFNKGLIKTMPSTREIKEMAANIVRNTVPNYEYVPEFIRALRRFPVGNFVSFPAEILRIGTGIVQQSIKEINDPILRTIGMKRLAGLALTTAVVPPAIVEMFKTIYDYTDDELAALKRFLPSWSKNSTILPMRDEETGDLKYIDFSHGFAFDTLTRPIQTILNKVAEGETNEEALMEGFMKGLGVSAAELGEPFISESIWTEAILDVVRGGGKTKDGKVLYTDATPAGEKVSNIINHLVKSQAPFSLQQLIRLGFAATGEPSRTVGPYAGTGQEYNLTDEALGFTGYRPVTIDPARSLDFKMSGYQRGIRDARREFNAKLLRGDPISPQDVVDRYIIANKAKWEEMKEMSQDLTAGMILGTSENDIMNVLGRISRKDGAALLTNQFIPFTISENVQQVFEDNARKLGMENPYRVAERALQSLAQTMSGIPLSSPEWPDLTDIFDFRPQRDSFFNLGQQAPGDTTGFNPSVYARPSLTLNNQGLTQNQAALLSPSEQEIARKQNQRTT